MAPTCTNGQKASRTITKVLMTATRLATSKVLARLITTGGKPGKMGGKIVKGKLGKSKDGKGKGGRVPNFSVILC